MNYKFASVAAAGLFAAGAATAGGYVAPIVEPVPVAPVITPAPVGNWAGGYAGATLGYAFGGEDVVGIRTTATDNFLGDAGEFKLSGLNGGLRAGYLWQRDRWVFGPELSIEGGNIEDDITLGGTGIPASLTEGTFSVNHLLQLKLRTGYEIAPNTLLFGTAGVSRGDFNYEFAGIGDHDFDATGYVFGIGVERKMTERVSITGEIERNQFSAETIEVGPYTTTVSPSFNNVKVGVNFSF